MTKEIGAKHGLPFLWTNQEWSRLMTEWSSRVLQFSHINFFIQSRVCLLSAKLHLISRGTVALASWLNWGHGGPSKSLEGHISENMADCDRFYCSTNTNWTKLCVCVYLCACIVCLCVKYISAYIKILSDFLVSLLILLNTLSHLWMSNGYSAN